MKSPQYAILWDMDGTLIDTTEMHFKAWDNIFHQYDKKLVYEDFIKYFGRNNQAFLADFFPELDESLHNALSDKKEINFCKEAKGNSRLYPGALELLQYFQSKGYKQAIASSAPMMNIDVLLDETNIRAFFDYCASGGNLPAKPDPTLFLSVAQKLGISSENCLVIEDSTAGVQGAINAGMHSVAITNSRAADELQEADLVISAFTNDVFKQVENLLLN